VTAIVTQLRPVASLSRPLSFFPRDRTAEIRGKANEQQRGALNVWKLARKAELLQRGLLTLVSSEKLTIEALGKGLCVFGLSKAEHHKVAVIAAQGVRERRRR
jgi:hypothetical protein